METEGAENAVPVVPRPDRLPAGDDGADAVRAGYSHLGRTVLAGRDFEADEAIGRVTGTWIPDPDYESDYCIELDAGSLEPDAPWRWLNHSCDPNCEFVSWDDAANEGQPEEVWLAALRPIAAGEELTVDYAWPPEAALPCACRSPNCRGWIVGTDHFPLPGLPG